MLGCQDAVMAVLSASASVRTRSRGDLMAVCRCQDLQGPGLVLTALILLSFTASPGGTQSSTLVAALRRLTTQPSSESLAVSQQ